MLAVGDPGMVQPSSSCICRSPLVGRLRTVDIVGIGQPVEAGGMKIRLASPEIEPQAEEVGGIHIMPPYQLGVLIVFLLVLIDGL